MGESFEGVGVLSAPLTPKVHPPPDLRAARCAEVQHGIITTRQLAARGLGSQAISVRVRAGWLHRVHRGVYAVGCGPLTLQARFMAAGPAPTRSVFEKVVLELLRDAGLPEPHVNVELVIAGRRIVPDFRWPAQQLVVEADGAVWHDNRAAREADAERQALLEAHGERVVRITCNQAARQPRQTIERIRVALER